MLTVTYLGPDNVKPIKKDRPIVKSGQALVRIAACGVCGSDLSIAAGKHPRAAAPLVLGHECSGTIVEIHSDEGNSSLSEGGKVVLFPLLPCGDCYACRHGFSHVCHSLEVIGFDKDGGMAEYLAVDQEQLLSIPDEIPLERAALIEPMAVGVHALNRVNITPGIRALILGGGPVGILLGLALKQYDIPEFYITDVNPTRLELAGKLGLNAINVETTDLEQLIARQTGGEGIDLVFEVTGVEEVARSMTKLVRSRGTIVNVSVFKQPPRIDMRDINFKEITLLGSRVYTKEDFQVAIDLAKKLPLEQLVTHRYPLKKVRHGFHLLTNSRQVGKMLFSPREA